MSDVQGLRAGDIPALLQANPLSKLSVEKEEMLDNVRSALARKLPRRAGQFKAHDRTLSVAGGGPSLADTYQDFKGDVAAINKSLAFLLDKNIVPNFCGILDPGPHMADEIDAHPDVWYFVASICNPVVFDKLANCKVILWHPGGIPDLEEGPLAVRPLVFGGSTMGLRWITLGHLMGYRTFDLHGLDSSYLVEDEKLQTHAYPDRRDKTIKPIIIEGYPTTLNFLHQVGDFVQMVEYFRQDPNEPGVQFRVNGTGLLQYVWEDIINDRPLPSGLRELQELPRTG